MTPVRPVRVTGFGPGGITGGLQWGSATDGTRIYVAESDSGRPTTPTDAPSGRFLGCARPGDRPDPLADGRPSPLQRCPGTDGRGPGERGEWRRVRLFAGRGRAHVCHGSRGDGARLWSYASGGSCIGGAAISNGRVYWGLGLRGIGHYSTACTGNNKLFAFGLP